LQIGKDYLKLGLKLLIKILKLKYIFLLKILVTAIVVLVLMHRLSQCEAALVGVLRFWARSWCGRWAVKV